VILKGKEVDEPPDMPAFAEKGVTVEQAKALIAYMKQLKKDADKKEPNP
jgi:mono/diheme cytochrome c family protein